MEQEHLERLRVLWQHHHWNPAWGSAPDLPRMEFPEPDDEPTGSSGGSRKAADRDCGGRGDGHDSPDATFWGDGPVDLLH